MTGHEEFRSRILLVESGHTRVDAIRDAIERSEETLVDHAAIAFRVSNRDEGKVSDPVRNVIRSSVGDDDAIFLRVEATVALSLGDKVVEHLNLSHSRVEAASLATIP